MNLTIYQVLCLIGVPALISSILLYMWKKLKDNAAETKAIKSGIQALLRDRLIQSYKYYSNKGWADMDDRDNFENMYVQYHSLGKNGVMDDMRKKFLALPATPNQ